MNEKALGLLGIARKGGFVEIGEDPVTEAVRTGHVRLIVTAADAGEHTIRRVENLASIHHTPVVVFENDKASLGSVFGRGSVAMIAVTDANLAVRILERLDQPQRCQAQLDAVREKAASITRRKQTKPNSRKRKEKH